jgi:hypothetical protein
VGLYRPRVKLALLRGVWQRRQPFWKRHFCSPAITRR